MRRIGDKASLSVSGTAYMRNYLNDSRVPGETLTREYGLISAGYLHEILAYRRMHVQALGEVSYRAGSEMIFIYSYGWEAIVESLSLRDWGLTAGLRGTYDLPWRFLLSAEAKYTRFVYLYDEGVSFNIDREVATLHDLTVKIGLGYQF